jgi:TM2 domain-containing membrane protein YozV
MHKQDVPTHSIFVGYILWIFGFTGSHRFYYGRPITGTIWFFTFGLCGLGWLFDLFLIPSMDDKANRTYVRGKLDYNLAWLFLTFFGMFGLHRMYMGKWISGLIWALTGGFFLLGWIYDYWTLNSQIDEINAG